MHENQHKSKNRIRIKHFTRMQSINRSKLASAHKTGCPPMHLITTHHPQNPPTANARWQVNYSRLQRVQLHRALDPHVTVAVYVPNTRTLPLPLLLLSLSSSLSLVTDLNKYILCLVGFCCAFGCAMQRRRTRRRPTSEILLFVVWSNL